MKMILPLGVLFVCVSCNMRQPPPDNNAMPEALQPNNQSSGELIFSKRSVGNIINALYDEEVKKSALLSALEKQISDTKRIKRDTLALYTDFFAKNDDYYSTANWMDSTITDSLLKQKIKLLLQKSKQGFEQHSNDLSVLMQDLDAKDNTLTDLHTVLKLIVTLPLIEQYQLQSKPAQQPLVMLQHNYTNTINAIDSITSK